MQSKKVELKLKNLSVQFNLIVIGIPTLILMGFGLFQLKTQAFALEKDLGNILQHEASQLSASLSTAMFNFDDETSRAICQAALKKPEIEKIIILEEGEVYLSFASENFTGDDTADAKVLETGIYFRGEQIGGLKVVATTRHMKQRLTDLKRSIVIQICVLDIVLGLVMAVVLRLRFVRPLKTLEMESEKIAAGDLAYPINVSRSDEIGALAANLLSMRNAVREKVASLESEILRHEKTSTDLKRTKDYIDNILDSMPSILIAVDPELRVSLWNSKAGEVTGKTGGDVFGRPVTELLPNLAPMEADILATIQTRRLYTKSRIPVKTDSGIAYRDIAVYPLISKYLSGAVIRIDDVTEHVKMEQMVVQSEKMMSVGGLAAGMAHEINNPLAGMMQNAQVVLRRINEDLPASIKTAEEVGITLERVRAFMEKRGINRQLSSIHDAGIRASQIVQNMLSFARKDYVGKSLQDIPHILDLALELASSDYDLKKQYDFKSIRVEKQYEPDLPRVMCEAGKLQQVFFNLFKNSAQAGRQSLQPDKKNLKLELRVSRVGPEILVEIGDNGPGMSESVQKRIFDPFFTTKPVGEGTGLGLSVAYFIVTDNHSGRMSVVSAEGKGTRFLMYLPIS